VELAVRPEDLHAAAVALAACARRIDDARDAFARAATREVPDLGRQAVGAAGESASRAEQAVTTIADDVAELARALRLLAHVYAELDRSAVRR
jgi:hypothetical protein